MGSGRGSAGAVAAMVLAAALAGGCRRGTEQADQLPVISGLVASCAWVEGEVEVRQGGSVYWEPVAVGGLFRAGDWVRTAAGARARLELFAGGGLEVEPGTLVVIELTLSGGGESEPMVAVESGAVRGLLAPVESGVQSGSGLTVRTADGARVRLSASGLEGVPAVVTVSAEAGLTQLVLAEGEAELRTGGGQRRALVAGQLLELVAGAASERVQRLELPESLWPAVDARVVLGADESLALRWAPVDGAKGYRVQVARDFSFRKLERDERLEATSFEFACQGERAWRVAAVDAQGRAGEFGFARRVYCERRASR